MNQPAPIEPVVAPRLVTPRFLIVVASGLCYFLAVAMLTPVLPHYVEDSLGWGSIEVGIAVGAFSVGAVVLRTYAGRVGDRIGRRILIIGGALVVAISTLLYPVIHALWWLVLMRTFTGFGEAGFFVGAATMITDLSPEHRRGEAVSYWSIAVYGGLAFGPALGEFLRGSSRYTLTFVASASLAFVAALIGLFTVEVPREVSPKPYPFLFHRGTLKPGSVLFLGLIALAGFSAFMPLYASNQLDIDSGPIFLLYGILILIVRIAGARVPDRLGGRDSGSIALLLTAIGVGVMALWSTVAGLIAGTVVFAAGMSLMYPALLLLSLVGTEDDERAAVVGTFSSFFDASQGIGALICGVVVAVSGNRGAFATGAVCAVLGLVLLRARTS
jgi:MFS family permease